MVMTYPDETRTVTPCAVCGGTDRYPSGDCKPCTKRRKDKRKELQRAAQAAVEAAGRSPYISNAKAAEDAPGTIVDGPPGVAVLSWDDSAFTDGPHTIPEGVQVVELDHLEQWGSPATEAASEAHTEPAATRLVPPDPEDEPARVHMGDKRPLASVLAAEASAYAPWVPTPDELDRHLLRTMRKALGLSQIRLAEVLNIHRTTIQRWETGEITIERPAMVYYALRGIEVEAGSGSGNGS